MRHTPLHASRVECELLLVSLQLHYLLHGTGMQTWEYSPAYGIRSYAYLALHSLPLLPLTALAQVRVPRRGEVRSDRS